MLSSTQVCNSGRRGTRRVVEGQPEMCALCGFVIGDRPEISKAA